jgi:hypothetical protein
MSKADAGRMLLLWDRWVTSRHSDLRAFAESVNADESFVLTAYVTPEGITGTSVDTATARRERALTDKQVTPPKVTEP